MKTSEDPRHIRRQELVQQLFKIAFHKQPVTNEAKHIIENLPIIDESIRKAAPEYPLEKINRVDLAILRLGTYELIIERKEPVNVIIDEAIELAKEFAGDSSPAFINGALGKISTYDTPTNI